MLYQQAKARDPVKREGITSKPDQHPEWPAFLDKLRRLGYFQEEVEGSKLYQEKLATAREYFSIQKCQRDGTTASDDDVSYK